MCDADVHAVFDPIKRECRARPRCRVQAICDLAAEKSPFWRSFVSPWFTGVDAEPWVFSSHRHIWSQTGGCKGLHLAQATDMLTLRTASKVLLGVSQVLA